MIDYEKLATKFREADAVIVLASNGFSITEGLNIFASNEKFRQNFGWFERKFGVRNLLEGLSFNYPSKAEKWAFYAKFAKIYLLDYEISPAMKDLQNLLQKKPHFIVTSNIEAHFALSGFSDIYEVEGSVLNFQCENGCSSSLTNGFESLKMMANEPENAVKFLPKCEKCGSDLDTHTVFARRFVGAKNGEKFNAFLEQNFNANVLFIELGVGARNQMIKAPLMKVAAQMPNATYVSVNLSEPYVANFVPNGIEVAAKIDEFLANLHSKMV